MDSSDQFRCLLCPDDASFCSTNKHHTAHPKQQLFSDDLLLDNLDINADDPEFLEVKIFNCPYCDRPKLSISALYDHLTLEHLDIEFNVCCPICVCFGENHNVVQNMHLSEHIAAEHSASFEQYEKNIQIANKHSQPEGDLLKFIASTLPPTYYGATAESTNQPATSSNTSSSQKLEPEDDPDEECPICWDPFSDSDSRQLNCKHTFHSECIQQWVDQNNSCPMCRKCAQ
ncbi:E3 ubiquitin-protein ligase KCMF1-like [Sabethes cyaneus]|uniref:E3 ubiquitin-protein ligase KCMF1-like n=1 Tax=Sabethes cyaneus TaxID=53552 RepID=UPI00237D7918|nr:E3 ubiquitin-protein ligase KCMF1-like [Sabethes cyaneus]